MDLLHPFGPKAALASDLKGLSPDQRRSRHDASDIACAAQSLDRQAAREKRHEVAKPKPMRSIRPCPIRPRGPESSLKGESSARRPFGRKKCLVPQELACKCSRSGQNCAHARSQLTTLPPTLFTLLIGLPMTSRLRQLALAAGAAAGGLPPRPRRHRKSEPDRGDRSRFPRYSPRQRVARRSR